MIYIQNIKNKDTLAYLGGLFDGEGYAGLYANGLVCGIEMNKIEGLEVLISVFGGNIAFVPPRRGHPSNAFRVSYTGVKAAAVLRGLSAYCVVKRLQLETLLEYWDDFRWSSKVRREVVVQECRQKLNSLGYVGKNYVTGHPRGVKNKQHQIVKKGYGGDKTLFTIINDPILVK
jgi:hypothetical protein